MASRQILETELILNPDGSIYHLNILPEELADTIILVGDPSRAPIVSSYFDRVEIKKTKREFVVHTGRIGQQRISVIATGIGSGNIDIVLNEIDALANVDFKTRKVKDNLTKLKIIRLGTCGSLSPKIAVDSLVLSTYAFSFDGLLNYYQHEFNDDEKSLLSKIKQHFSKLHIVGNPYVAKIADVWLPILEDMTNRGITLSCLGFYGPQHRRIRVPLIEQNIFEMAKNLEFQNDKIVNLEMETAAIYGLGKILGHECCSISTVIANRMNQQVSTDPDRAIRKMIEHVFDRLF